MSAVFFTYVHRHLISLLRLMRPLPNAFYAVLGYWLCTQIHWETATCHKVVLLEPGFVLDFKTHILWGKYVLVREGIVLLRPIHDFTCNIMFYSA